ncbi:MAG: hypothetical protein Q4G58_17035 [bacterium]|nr:hypothetical protein [bacterium]
MDQTTLKMDQKLIRNLMAGSFAGIFLTVAIGCGIYYMVSGPLWTSGNIRSFEVCTYLALALMVFVIGLVITYCVGVRMNYMDHFRVRRSYAYKIRKQSVMMYSPIAALFVCIVKAGSGYVILSQRTPNLGTYLLFFVVAYLLYTVMIGAAVTFLLTLKKFSYIVAIGILPWIFTYFASNNTIPVWLGIWNIGKAAALCVAVAFLWGVLLLRLKKICYHISIG